jgi:hypothetical protein
MQGKEGGGKEGASAPGGQVLDADVTPEEMQMMAAMGIPFTFDTTAGKQVLGVGRCAAQAWGGRRWGRRG